VRMARRELDWFTIKYRDIFVIVIALAVLLVAGGSTFWYWRYQTNPQGQAERAISRAQRMMDSLSGGEPAPEIRTTLSQARTTLGQAREEYSQQRYAKALALAKDVIETLKGAQSSLPTSQKFAVLVSSEGTVEVKRTSQHLFSTAKENMILEDGDIVKTGQNSWAKIKYHNNQTQIISPDSLVVIQSLTARLDGGSRIEVALQQGRVETQTPETMTAKDESIIATGTTKVRPAPASRVGVAQEPSGEVVTSVFAGASEVEAAGKSMNVEAGDTGASIVTSSTAIGQLASLVAPPQAEFPRDQQILRVDDPVHHPVSFEWKGGAGAAAIFQLSAKPLFSSLLAPEQVVSGGKFTVDGLPAGTYYWRLRSPGDVEKTYWSPIFRFRILQVYQRPKVQRDLKLAVDSTPIGDGVILQGKTDPGVAVSVNDLEIPVNADGSFSKIVIFRDVGTQAVQVRAFDNEGNEKIWRKSFQSNAY
jgi:uncharacterized membrane protein